MTQAKHTPTPWELEGNCHIKSIEGWAIADCDLDYSSLNLDQQEINASFIVKAVNSHEALVEALKRISNGEFTADVSSEECLLAMRQVAREALKQAEEK